MTPADRPLTASFFARPALEVARDLLGATLAHATPEGVVTGRVVETEAYGGDDPGSHAYRRRTARNAPMFEAPGRAYVYFTYGMHHMLNVVTDPEEVPGAVLLRAVEPVEGIELMRSRRPGIADRDLARGPGRLTRAFAVSMEHNRATMMVPPLQLRAGTVPDGSRVIATERIGLGAAQDGRAWRFVVEGSRWASGPRGMNVRG